jgi:hypothetical protein
MAYSWPIWVDVQACTYKSSKSYGARDTNAQTIYVGSSAKNSHQFVGITNYKRAHEEYKGHKDVIVFKCKIDGITVKEMIFKSNRGRAGELLETVSRLKGEG